MQANCRKNDINPAKSIGFYNGNNEQIQTIRNLAFYGELQVYLIFQFDDTYFPS